MPLIVRSKFLLRVLNILIHDLYFDLPGKEISTSNGVFSLRLSDQDFVLDPERVSEY